MIEHKQFASAAAFRRWLEKNHDRATELQIRFYRTGLKKKGLSYLEAVEEALCFGWIDGVRRRFDDESFLNRFTPRRKGSNWSLINVAHIKRLTAAGRMHPAGLAAYAAREAKKTGIYSFEQPPATLPPEFEREFRTDAKAWAFFTSQAPWYQRLATHKIVSPKNEPTRRRWLERVMTASAEGRRFQ